MRLPTIFKPKPTQVAPAGADAAFQQKVARFRVQHGMLERVIVPAACAKTDRPFRAVFERSHAGEKFRLARIEKMEASAGGGPAKAPQTFSIDDMDFSGWRCPWCGDARLTVQCSQCGVTICAGRVRDQDGQQLFQCRDSCNARGVLVDTKDVFASRDEAKRSEFKQLPSQASRPRLSGPGSNLPRISGPKK